MRLLTDEGQYLGDCDIRPNEVPRLLIPRWNGGPDLKPGLNDLYEPWDWLFLRFALWVGKDGGQELVLVIHHTEAFLLERAEGFVPTQAEAA